MDCIFFLHVPKTGGTSLSTALSKKFPAWQICPWHHSRLDLFSRTDLKNFRLFHGHYAIFDFDYVPKPAKSVTLIRQPQKRVLSLYNFWRSFRLDVYPEHEPHPGRVARSVDLKTFLTLPNPSVRVSIDNALVQAYLPYLLRGRNQELVASRETIIDDALQTLDRMTAFGMLERFDDTVKAISAELGCPLVLPAERMRRFEALEANEFHEPFEREPVTPEIDDLLRSTTELDQEFFDRAGALFESKFGHHARTGANQQGAAMDDRSEAAYRWGDWINLGADFHLEGVQMTGWSMREAWGVWSITDRPTLRVGPLPRASGIVRLTMMVRAAVFTAYREQTTTVLLDGRPVETWKFELNGDERRWIKTLNIPASALDEDGFLNFTFEVNRPMSPRAAGVSDDERELGLALENIHLECVA